MEDDLLERLVGVRYPLASHPTIDSVYHLQPEVLRIRFQAGTLP